MRPLLRQARQAFQDALESGYSVQQARCWVIAQLGGALCAKLLGRNLTLEQLGFSQLLPSDPKLTGAYSWPRLEQLDGYSLGAIYQELCTHRKQTGTFYSPKGLAEELTRFAFETKNFSQTPKVCDPALGCGAFLLAALSELKRRFPNHGNYQELLYGTDLDPGALATARLALWLHLEAPETIPRDSFRHLRLGNALVGEVLDTCPNQEGFNWQKNYPQVFSSENGGFELILGNPPWETLQTQVRESFSQLYSDRTRQEAEQEQSDYLAQRPEDQAIWQNHQALLESQRDYFKQSANGYILQGRGKLYTYKLFLERALQLLNSQGSFHFVIPGAFYADQGCIELRRHLLERHTLNYLIGFENRANWFAIDSRYKFCLLGVSRGASEPPAQTRFLSQSIPSQGLKALPLTAYSAAQVVRYSPKNYSFLEIEGPKDLDCIDTLMNNGVPMSFSQEGPWKLSFSQGDFNMTSHIEHFVATSEKLEGPAENYLPLLEGRMLAPYRSNAKAWLSGRGRKAQWAQVDELDSELQPQFLVRRETFEKKPSNPHKVSIMAISSATNARTTIACPLIDRPCGNSLVNIYTHQGLIEALKLTAVLNSFAFDFAMRIRLVGNNLNRFILEQCHLLAPEDLPEEVAWWVARLSFTLPEQVTLWQSFDSLPGWFIPGQAVLLDPEERKEAQSYLQGCIAYLWGLSTKDFRYILRGCELDSSQYQRAQRGQLPLKGFWRIDSTLPPAQRLTQRSLRILEDLSGIPLAGRSRSKVVAHFLHQKLMPAFGFTGPNYFVGVAMPNPVLTAPE